MANVINVILVIVGIFLTIVGIDYLIKVFFRELFSYHKKSNDDAMQQFNKIFDKFPEVMMKTIKGVMKLEDDKEKERMTRKYKDLEKELNEEDIDDWSLKD